MKTIITTVGTSIFANYQEERNDLNDKIKDLELKPYSKWNDWEDDIKNIRKTINKWLNKNSSAEIKSLLKIQEKLDSKLDVILLTSDTILSYLAAEIVKTFFESDNNVSIEKDIIVVKDLQVEDYSKFTKGRENLVKKIRNIINNEIEKEKNSKKAFDKISKNYVFCISGGYKIVIPVITIISQIYRMKCFYIFEKSDDLIETALLPLGFDDFLLEKLYFSIDMLKHQEGYVEKDNSIKDRLKSANFIIEGKITELGELFYDYVHHNREISRSVLGYFAEYKLYEYFIEQENYKNIKHSYTEYDIKNGKNKVELDFVLNDKIIVEVKPMGRFLKTGDYQGVLKQIKKQIADYPQYRQYHLYLYTSSKEISSKHERIKKNLEAFYIELRKAYHEIEFKVFEVYWSLKGKNDNQYQEFMKKKLQDKDITEINITGGKDV